MFRLIAILIGLAILASAIYFALVGG